jgi:transcription initiation factor IIE alpha subunit
VVVKIEESKYINVLHLEERCKICNAINYFILPETQYKNNMEDAYGMIYKCVECGTLNETNHEEYLQYLKDYKIKELEKNQNKEKEIIIKL